MPFSEFPCLYRGCVKTDIRPWYKYTEPLNIISGYFKADCEIGIKANRSLLIMWKWCDIQNSCSAFNPSKVHTHSSEHTHCEHTPGAVDSHLCCGTRGAVRCSRAPQSWNWGWRERCKFPPPTYNSCFGAFLQNLCCVIKLHILEWPFIVSSLRHTCAIIMLSNQHLDMPHLWGGWIISAKEKCSLTQI